MRLMIISFFIVKAFSTVLCQEIKFDSIQVKDITIDKQCLLYENKKVAKRIFGQKYKVDKVYNCFTEETEIVHDYGTNSITFSPKGLITGFSIKTDNHLLLDTFRVGQSKLIEFKSLFPKGYDNFADYGRHEFIKIAIKGNDDTFLIFRFEDDILVTMKIWYDY